MYKVKFIHNFPDFPILRQTPGYSSKWGNYEFFLDRVSEDYDFLVVFSYQPEEIRIKCSRENTIFVTGEPPSIQTFNIEFLRQYNHIISCQRNIDHPNLFLNQQGLPWHVKKSYDQLKKIRKIKKTKNISVITSNKLFTEGHRKRYEFCMKLKEVFKDKIDLYGRGVNDFEDKWDVLSEYKYSIAIENDFLEDYVTEKLSDCYLAYTLPIYYGCPNIDKYYNVESLVKIDINDFEFSKKTIEDLIDNESYYDEHFKFINESRTKVLDQYNFFAMIVDFIERKKINPKSCKEDLLIRKEKFFTDPPRISVLMPVYNSEKYLKESIDSILNQTYNNFEFIIIDDGSTDKSNEIIKSYTDTRIRLIENKENLGLIKSLNKGILEVQTDYIARMDSDDISDLSRLEKQLKFMEENKEIGVCGTNYKVIDQEFISNHPLKHVDIKEAFLHLGSVIAHPSVMIRTNVLKENNIKYDPRFQHMEDFRLWEQLLSLTQFANLAEPLLNYRRHENQISSTKRDVIAINHKLVQSCLIAKPLEGKLSPLDRYLLDLLVLDDQIDRKSYFINLLKVLNLLINSNKTNNYYNSADYENLIENLFYSKLRKSEHLDLITLPYLLLLRLRSKLNIKKMKRILIISLKKFRNIVRNQKNQFTKIKDKNEYDFIIEIFGDINTQIKQISLYYYLKDKGFKVAINLNQFGLMKYHKFYLDSIKDIYIANNVQIDSLKNKGVLVPKDINKIKPKKYISTYGNFIETKPYIQKVVELANVKVDVSETLK